eukprot:3719381-Ditylum_brightwellii.AAC.1
MAAKLCGGIGELHARAFAMVLEKRFVCYGRCVWHSNCRVFPLQALQQEGAEVTGGCENVQKLLLVNAALCFMNIVMAAYISNKVQMEKGSDIEEDRTFYKADFSNTRNNS